MSKGKKRIIVDLLIVVTSILIAVYLAEIGVISKLVMFLGGFKWIGIFISGIFFTSFFTAAPAVVLLGIFSENTSLLALALLGGFGAMAGDYIIFRFVKDRISEDIKYLLSHQKGNRFFVIFKTTLFNFFLPFIAAVIIASPLPDEIGVAMLGMTKMESRKFLLLSFVLNSIGILVIGLVARAIIS